MISQKWSRSFFTINIISTREKVNLNELKSWSGVCLVRLLSLPLSRPSIHPLKYTYSYTRYNSTNKASSASRTHTLQTCKGIDTAWHVRATFWAEHGNHCAYRSNSRRTHHENVDSDLEYDLCLFKISCFLLTCTCCYGVEEKFTKIDTNHSSNSSFAAVWCDA